MEPARIGAALPFGFTINFVIRGSDGRSALGNLVKGSVAKQVHAHCKAPVLLVR